MDYKYYFILIDRLITHDRRQSRGWCFHRRLSVCLFYTQYLKKTDAARITKLVIQIFHDEFWEALYFGVKKVTKTGLSWLIARVLASFSLWF